MDKKANKKLINLFKLSKQNKELSIDKLKYKKDSLNPIMSDDTLNYHYEKLAKAYADKYNNNIGDSDFNEAGVFLHNIFFKQFTEPKRSNKPFGLSLNLIESKFKTFDDFKKMIKEEAMKIQGSGWIYLSNSGDIKKIKNHQIKNDILVLIDWWEHAWALDYEHDKGKYMDNIWQIIDWNFINNKLEN